MSTYDKIADINTKLDVSGSRRYSDIEAFLPKDLKDAVKGLTDQIKVDVGWKGQQYGGEMGALESDIKLSEIMHSKDGIRGDGKLASSAERQMDRLGRGVSRLSDKANKEAERLGKSYGKFIDSMVKDLQRFKDALGKTVNDTSKAADQYVTAAAKKTTEAKKVIGTVGGEAIAIEKLAADQFKLTIGATDHGVHADISAFQEKLGEELRTVAENMTRTRVDSIARVDELLRDHLGDIKGGIAEFRSENLGKLESILGRQAGSKTTSTATEAAGKAMEHGQPPVHEPAGFPTGRVAGYAAGGAVAGYLAGKFVGDDGSNTALYTGGGAVAGGLLGYLTRGGKEVANQMGAVITGGRARELITEMAGHARIP